MEKLSLGWFSERIKKVCRTRSEAAWFLDISWRGYPGIFALNNLIALFNIMLQLIWNNWKLNETYLQWVSNSICWPLTISRISWFEVIFSDSWRKWAERPLLKWCTWSLKCSFITGKNFGNSITLTFVNFVNIALSIEVTFCLPLSHFFW